MSEPASRATPAKCPASPRARWMALGVFLFFLLKGLAWIAIPALVALGLWRD